MRLQEDIDFTTLTWVKAELDETLKQARHALEAYVEDPADASQMRFCATYLHQVQGTLRMVELYGAAMVTEEMEHLASALLENEVKQRDEAYQVLMRGIVQLPDYLERLQTGHKDIPIVLLPLLNELRGARGEKSLSEMVLFTPDLTRPLPLSAKGPLTSLPELELRHIAEQLRSQFQLALLNWFRNVDADGNITRISQVCDKLVAIVSQEDARRLFWVAAGVMEALRSKAFEPSPQLKQTIGKVEREIKRLADAGEASFRVDPPRELTRNLLYFVAHAPTEHGRIGELRQIFRLDSLLPTEAELAHARGSMSGHNRALLDTVSGAIKEDLLRVKDALDLHLRTQNASPAGLVPQIEVLDRVSDTLGMMGLGVARRVVQEQRAAVHQVTIGQRSADEATLLDIAGALLYVEASLDDQVQHLGGGGADESIGRPQPQAEARKVLEVVIKEAQANFAQAKQCFVAFIESSWDHAQLQDVPRLLEEVSGAMRILELQEAPGYLLAIRRFTESELLARRRVPNGPQMDTLADALASLEYYLEAVREHRSGRDKILEVTRTSLETLGYWPIPADIIMPAPPPAPAPKPAPAEPEPVEAKQPATPAPTPAAPAPTEAPPVSAPATSAAKPAAPAPVVAPPPTSAPAAPAVGTAIAGFEGGSEEIDEEIREVFIEEVQEEISNLKELLPTWTDDPHNLDNLKPIRRVFHTLKGSGRLVGAQTLGEFSWKIENMLNRVLDKTIQPTQQVQALVGHANDVLPRLLAALRGESGVRADVEGIKAVAERLAAGEEATYEAPVAVAVPEPVAPEPMPEPELAAPAEPAPEPVVELEPEPEPEPAPAPVAASLIELDPVLYDILKAEVAGHLDTMHDYLDAAYAAPKPVTDVLLRAIHTMNGAFAMTDVPVITEVIGPLEGYVKRLLAQGAVPPPNGLALIADAADAVKDLMVELDTGSPRLPDLSDLAARIIAIRDELPEPSGPSVPLHAFEDVELTEAISLEPTMRSTPLAPTPVAPTPVAPAPEPPAAVEPAMEEEHFLSFGSFEPEPPVTPSLPVETPAPVSADALVDAFVAGTEPPAPEEEVVLETPIVSAPELTEPTLEDIDAVFGESFDEGHIDHVAAAEPPLEAAAEVAAPGADSEDIALEAELLALGDMELDSDVPVEFEILEADSLSGDLELESVEPASPAPSSEAEPTPAETAELAELGGLAEAPEPTRETAAPVSDDAAALEAMIAAFESGFADTNAATREAQVKAEREAAQRELEQREARERAEAEAEARAAREAEQAEAARRAETEAAERAARDAEEREAAEAAEREAEQARAEAEAREAAEAKAAADAAAAREAEELAELEAQIAALEAADAAKEKATQAEPEMADEAPILEAEPLLPAEPLADFAAEEAAHERAAAPAPSAARMVTVADADPDPDAPLDMSDLDADLLDIFMEEGVDLLDHSDGLMARLRESPEDKDIVVGLQRDLHTLKGGARMAGITPIGDLGHAMESLLEAVADGKRELSASGVETLERCFDRLHSMVTRVGQRRALAMPATLIDRVEALGRGEVLAAYAAPDGAAPVAKPAEVVPAAPEEVEEVVPTLPVEPRKPTAASVAQLSEPMADEDDISVRAPQEQIRIRADLLDRLVNYAGEVAIYRARLEQQLGLFRGNLGELDQTTTRLREQLRKLEIETEAQIVARYQREAEVGDSAFDPLELDRFSTLQQLSRALSESAADIVSLQTTLEDHTRQYETLLLQQSRVSSELQEGLMRTRMVPFDSLVPRLRRIIRQTAGELGKKAQLKVEGAQGEMDRNVLDRMTAPLEHMLRNALAHGLETPAERVKAGKPEEGTVRIGVRREGSEVVISVSDDGRGLDRDAIRKKALERGLMKPDAQLSDRDLYGFILETGFSTAQTVSKIAGRGVGMDVVHSEIRQLGGSLYIESERGKGSEFVVRLPFTLAVTQAVFVKHGETSFAVPIASVQGVARIDRANLEQQLAGGDPTFRYAGEEYAIYDLGLLLGQSHVRAEESLQVPLMLARSGDLRAAICVDHVIGSREIVVKPVGPQVSSIPGIFGATIMGDGRVIVILDVAPLVRRSAALRKLGDAPVLPPAPVEARRIPLVMVVDDSITMRKVTGRVLERHNYEVVTAKDGVDAIEKLQERIPDVMLLDIEMPRMDGYELATHMRNDARLRGIPIIMITSRTGEKHRQRAFEIGVDRYLGKPYQETELMRNVEEILKVGRGGGG